MTAMARLDQKDCDVIEDDGEFINLCLKNITKKYPIMESYPGLTMEYAKKYTSRCKFKSCNEKKIE